MHTLIRADLIPTAHKILCDKKKVLHQDISYNNIMLCTIDADTMPQTDADTPSFMGGSGVDTVSSASHPDAGSYKADNLTPGSSVH